ncbi:hypothetical protein BFP97_12155 [Roseivirga sp. 4D4]|nr:hypothetical protein BFP97_12155 [Roseivirga sp. 4D4]
MARLVPLSIELPIKRFLLVVIPTFGLIFLLDITFKFIIEYFNVIPLNPRVYNTSSVDFLTGYLSSLGLTLVISGWVYCIYYLLYSLLSPRLDKFQFYIKWLLSYCYYLLLFSIAEFLFEGFRMDVLLVLLISAIPMSLLTAKMIPFRALSKTI